MAKILIVEPDEQLAGQLESLLVEAGWAVERLSAGHDVEAQFAGAPPDIVVLDLAVDDGQGIAVCRRIRELEGGDLLPVLLIGSGNEGVRNFGDALVEGADYYFEKPLDEKKLVAKIRTYVGMEQDTPTLVEKHPAGESAPSEEDIEQRVERMLDLGAALKSGLLEPPGGDDEVAEETLREDESTVRQRVEPARVGGLVPPGGTESEEREQGGQTAPSIAGAGAPVGKMEMAEPGQEDLESIMSQLAEELEQDSEQPDGLDELAAETRAWSELENSRKETPSPERSEQKARREAEEKARREAEEKARREVEEKARREAEEKARREAEERARREAEEKARREAEERARREAQKLRHNRLRAETMAWREHDRRLRKELAARAIESERRKAVKASERRLQQPGEDDREAADAREYGKDEGFISDDDDVLEADALWQEDFDDGNGEHEHLAGTRAGGDNLIRLLEEEASLAREKAVDRDVPPAGDEDETPTVPDLPPRPDESEDREATSVRTEPGKASRLANVRRGDEDEEMFRAETEDIRPGAAVVADDVKTSLRMVPGSDTGKGKTEAAVSPGEEEEEVFQEPAPPRLRPPEPDQASLEAEGVPAIFWRLHCQRVTGQVVFSSGSDTKEVFFEDGDCVAVHSNQGADRLEEMLFREGLIDRAAYAEARLKGLASSRALAAHLVERGFLRPEELFGVVRRHFLECLLGLFEWEEGRIRYAPRLAEDREKVRLARPVSWLVLEGVRRRFSLPRMIRRIGSPASLLAPVPVEDRHPAVADVGAVGWLPQERQVLRLVNGNRPIEEIVFLSGQDELTVYRVLYAGVVLGLLAVVVRGLRGGAEPREEELGQRLAIARRRLEAKAAQVNQVSYFDLLGVSPAATPYEIASAYRKLATEFHPANYSHPRLADLRERLQLVRAALSEARDVLSDDLLREGYRQSLGGSDETD